MNQALLERLEALLQRDSEMRQRLLDEGRLHGGYPTEMQQIHIINARALDRIIDEHGWPGLAAVGERGSAAAWRIAQHAICTPQLQRRFLVALEEAVRSGDAPPQQAARLDDRIRFHEGRPQRYGTVLDWDAHGQLGCKLEDPAGIDARRDAVGMPPFHASLQEQQRAVAAEGGAPPRDLAAYRRSQADWALAVGWRSADTDSEAPD